MSTAAVTLEGAAKEQALDTAGIGGHPRGLTTLYFTEMWERLSYYGMRAILLLYMVAPTANGGLGMNNREAAPIVGAYLGSVYLSSLSGGWLADNLLGPRLAVLIGGIIIALGHFSLAFHSLTFFYIGLVLIILGTGLLKTNVSALVGCLYGPQDTRRDAGFLLYYQGINLGAFLAPFVCGTLATDPRFKSMLGNNGFRPEDSWHWGFGAAGVGMTFGLIQFLVGQRRLQGAGDRPKQAAPMSKLYLAVNIIFLSALSLSFLVRAPQIRATVEPILHMNPDTLVTWVFGGLALLILGSLGKYVTDSIKSGELSEIKRLSVVAILFSFSALFWGAFEQASTSLTLFADQMTDNQVFGIPFSSTYFQSVNPFCIFAFAPLISWWWIKQGDKQPSSPMKFVIALWLTGLGFFFAAGGAIAAGSTGKAAPYWLLMVYFLHTIGELHLSPVGMSLMTKLAPARMASQVMSVWFLSISVGNYMAGQVGGHFNAESRDSVIGLFGGVGGALVVGGLILLALVPIIKKLMGNVK